MSEQNLSEQKNFTLITGACGGLGRAFVLECAKKHENLLLLGTSIEKLKKLTDDFSDFLKEICVEIFECDLSKKDDREKVIEFINEKNIIINKLINNAGIILEGKLDRYSDEVIENVIRVNCIGTLDLTKKIIRIKNDNQKLEILTVSSLASFYPIPYMSVYSATKSFLTSMMMALSYEFKGKNIIFSILCPGAMETNKEMIETIKSMGFGGKLSTVSTEKVARAGLRGLKRRKKIVIPGFFNKLLYFLSKIFPKSMLTRSAGKLYKKSQEKRKF